ncbi:MAG: RNA polymerase sigma factor [Saprospiraceae bacterium]|nr:RNA polymerase sigma factor [Saprospiraceae bacterium]MCF8251176.1 RNA polymerase sigma factor [Saprospiraceae bacterium]MCF8281899.1 RNA polymerase sigma factor [Bacteroidales bacterium]MCF8312988.1 RNA polymerase sigma factor [Saprospiraceae bacterium]MCF8441435.1 RNA polymerase sigma factor [Saprospiraceae bacterium]
MVFLQSTTTEFEAIDDQSLVAAILTEDDRERQRQMQEVLYDRYADKVFYKCLSIVKNHETAKDLAHDILVKMFLKLKHFKGASPFYGWLFAITYNHCISYVRKQQRQRTEDFDAHSYDIAEDEIEQENLELKELKLEQLEQLLDELTESERLILLMRYQDDMAVKEIAEALDIGESAVKMRLKRSRDHLAELFKTIRQ